MGQADEAIRDGNYSHQLEPASDDRLPTTTARYSTGDVITWLECRQPYLVEPTGHPALRT
ncbi:hypothetical protein VFPBJ_07440 [Purpureocillium lilacinum]|uniref:Uncharacterized protein n=1 Tax=Purpureocillium lilacinum TaxID=33203 RepID=A0A179GHL1_PURLI|nr:hypothetical protein VFPBJ_07440 [Purpureocillium lilacinum]